MNLEKLADPFPAEDIEWRVSRAGMGSSGIYCSVLAYITARAIATRLDEVCGPANWRTTQMETFDLGGKVAVQVGISIRIGDEWITKYDVAEPTNIEPAKGAYSGAVKRAGAQWGIGRYLYHLDETFAEVSEEGGRGWNYSVLPQKHGGGKYFWKNPTLPAWALPKDDSISKGELEDLKQEWRVARAADVKNAADLLDGFKRFVASVVGEFPSADHTCWTRDALEKCQARIAETTEPGGVSSDVPFGE